MREASIGDVRNKGADVREPVAELRPLPRRRLGGRALIEQFHGLPPVDGDRLRADVDSLIDLSV